MAVFGLERSTRQEISLTHLLVQLFNTKLGDYSKQQSLVIRLPDRQRSDRKGTENAKNV